MRGIKNTVFFKTLFVLAVLALCFVSKTYAVDVSTEEFSDNFNALNDGNIIGQNGWSGTGVGTAAWSVASGGPGGSGKMVRQTADTANVLNSVITNTTESLGDSEVVVDFNVTAGFSPQIWLRRTGTGASVSGYLMSGPASNVRLYKYSSGTLTQISTGTVTTTIDNGSWYTVVFKAVTSGSTVNLTGYIYPQGTSRPGTATVTATDTSVTSASGYAGLGAHAGAVDYDNFVLNSITVQTAPGTPTGLMATSRSGRVELAWTAPSDNGGSAVTDYLVEYRTGSDDFAAFSHTASAAATTTVTGLTNGVSYDFKISAINVHGTSTATGVVSSTPAVTDIPVSNIKLWLNASTGTYVSSGGATSTNGTAVGLWTDQSGSGHNFVQTTTSPEKRPSLVTNVMSGWPVVRFDGSNDFLTNASTSDWTFLHDATGFSVFFVMKTTDADPSTLLTLYNTGGVVGTDVGSTLAIDDSLSSNGFYSPILNSTVPYPISQGDGDNLVSMQSSSIIASTYLYGGSEGDFNIYVNGSNVETQESAAAPTSSNSTYNLTLGAMSNGASYFLKGDVAEAIFFNTRVTTSVRQQVECYLSNKYGITVTSSCSQFVPSPIHDLVVTANDTQASLSWNASASNGAAITDYVIQYKLGSTSTWTTFSDGTSTNATATVTGLTVNTQYDFRVMPVNGEGQGLPSNIITKVTYSTTPTAPTASNVNFTGLQYVGGKLTGTYAYSDVNGDVEGTTTFRWLSSDSANGTYAAISGATSSIYLLTSNELNKFIKFEVTPVAASTPTTGSAATTSTSAAVGSALPIIWHILSTGQSLSTGSQGTPPLSTTQPYSNLMLSGSSLVALVEGGEGNETMSSAMANTLTALDNGNDYRSMVSVHGVSATAYTALKKGTSPYQTGMTQVSTAATAVAATSSSYQVAAVTIIHGETDHNNGTTSTQYEANLVELQRDYETDVKAVTGQTATIPLFTDQMGSFTTLNSATSGIPIAQLSAAENNPTKIYLVAPKYFLPYGDGSHLTNAGYRWLGEYYGKAMEKVLINGQTWTPLSPSQIVRNGNKIYAKFNVPEGPIVFDTSAVVEKTNYGFEYYDASASASIGSVEIFSTNTVRITLNTTSTGSDQRLRYAYTGSAGVNQSKSDARTALGNLRDSDSTASLYGNNLYNWAVHFDKAITEDQTGPVITSVTSTYGSNTSAMTWTTDEGSSSIVDYGLISGSYGTSTNESDQAYTVTSHSVSLNGLVPCARYYYRVRSRDFAQNIGLAGESGFNTTGCTGSAVINAQTQSSVAPSSGGTTSLTSGNANMSLTLPVGFTTNTATLQLQQLDKEDVLSTTSNPLGYSAIGSHIYHLQAFSDVTSTISSFIQPITVTMGYTESEISGYSESNLKIYRWTGSVWSELSGCSVKFISKTVVCQTNQFSTFGLFGLVPVAATASTGFSINTGSSGGGSQAISTPSTPASLITPTVTPPTMVTSTPSVIFSLLVPAPSATGTKITLPPVVKPIIFKRFLYVGYKGEDVRRLQALLRRLGYFKYQTNTGYFGSVTRDAVIRFQKAYKLAPYPGWLGPKTREWLNRLY